MIRSIRSVAVAALLAAVATNPAAAGIIFDINVNGSGSYSIDGGVTFINDPGVLETDPSSTIGVPVLTFFYPSGYSSQPGDLVVYNATDTAILGLGRATDAAGDLIGTHDLDRIILYAASTTGSDPADTGLPDNAGSNAATADANGTLSYTAGSNVYNVQFDVPEPGTLGLLGVATFGVGLARRRHPG